LPRVLDALGNIGAADIRTLRDCTGIREPMLPQLLWLHSMNFVTRREGTGRLPMLSAKWYITKAGRTYLKYLKGGEPPKEPAIPRLDILLVAPKGIRDSMAGSSVTDLPEALADIIGGAEREILVCSPFIDATLVPLVRLAKKDVVWKVLTDSPSNTLIRLKEERAGFEARTLKLVQRGVQMYQVHAKFVCVDKSNAIVTSANLNERSLYYNVELGVFVREKETCEQLAAVFDTVFKHGTPV
jgi:phosphatidylserine/phosphatidylglycerophosphate/cardiolipin synthase-like enzyme